MLKSLGACSPFVSIELGKSYVLTNVRVLDLDVLGRTIVAVPASQYLHLLHAASGKMTHSSNVFIHWSTINSAATFILQRGFRYARFHFRSEKHFYQRRNTNLFFGRNS